MARKKKSSSSTPKKRKVEPESTTSPLSDPPPRTTTSSSTLQQSTTTTTTVEFTIPNPSNSTKPIPCLQVLRSDSLPPGPHSNSHGSQSPPPHPPPALVFTHGAGGTLSAPAVVHFTTGFALATRGSVVAFQGSMNLGARVKGFDAVASHYQQSNTSAPRGANAGDSTPISCFGGRSMGARAAVMASSAHAHRNVTSLILVSYPLQSEKGAVRDQILLDLPAHVRVLFISGDRDGMCDLGQLDGVRKRMQARSAVVVVRGADHGMGVVVGVGAGGKRKKAVTEALGLETGMVAAQWLEHGGGGGGSGELWHGGTEGEIWWDGDLEEVRRSDGKVDGTVDKTKSATTTTTTKISTHPHPNKSDKTLPPPSNGKEPGLQPRPPPNNDAEAKTDNPSLPKSRKRKANPTPTSNQAGVPLSNNGQDQHTNPNPTHTRKKRKANQDQDQDHDPAVPTPKPPASPQALIARSKKSTDAPKRRTKLPATTKGTNTPPSEPDNHVPTTTTTRTRSSKRLKKPAA